MKAWRVYGANDIRCDELASQTVGPGCVKLKITYSAISLTDRLIFEGALSTDKAPIIIGRQGVGMVTETGAGVTGLQRGDHVAVDTYVPCGTCGNCKAGKTGECEKLLTYGVSEDGFLRDFFVVSENDVYKLPERIKDNEAIFIEHTAMALNAFNRLNVEKGEHIVIVGANIIALILTQIAIYHQAVPIVVDTRQDRLDAAAALGAYYTINSVDTDVQKKIFSLTGGRMAETAVYLANTKMPLNKTLSLVSRGGKAAFAGWGNFEDDMNIPLAPLINKQVSVFGVNNGSKFMASAINMLANKSVKVAQLISKEIAFDEVEGALKEMSESPDKYMKVLVKGV